MINRFRHPLIYALSRRINIFYLTIMMLTNAPRLFAHLHRQGWYRQLLLEWLQPCLNENHDAWLEIGCGPGLLSQELAELGIQIEALDRSEAMLRYASRQAKRASRKAVTFPRFSQGDAHHLPFPEQTFDWVLAASVINVVKQPIAVIKEMLRVAKPGAGIALLLPSTSMNLGNVEKTVKRLKLSPAEAAAIQLWASRANKMSERQITDWLTSAGCEDTQVINALDDMLLYVYARKKSAVL